MQLSSFVAGKPVRGPETLLVRDPYTGQIVGTVKQATRADLEAAIKAAVEFASPLNRFQRADILEQARAKLTASREAFARLISSESGLALQEAEFSKLLAYVWPALQKMKRRDEKYAAARAKLFTTEVGRAYLRELSIDELPGLTTPETTAIMLALCEALGMRIHFVAPAFGFQKNTPFPDNEALRGLIAPLAQIRVEVCRNLGIAGAQLEQRIARTIAQPHRGERRDQMALRFVAELGPLACVLQQARCLRVRAAPREDTAECEL